MRIPIGKEAGFANFFPASLSDLSAWSKKKDTILDKKQSMKEEKKSMIFLPKKMKAK